jgi:trans-aconitate methyltransferase
MTEVAEGWDRWVDRWERQQERYLVHREERFALMLDYAEAQLVDGPRNTLDLCCGNGTLSRRLAERFPGTPVTAVDWDPVHLEIARATLPADVEIIEADVTDHEWSGDIRNGAFDLIISATALHWLEDDSLVLLYHELARLASPSGLFLNADHFPVAEPQIRVLGHRLTEEWQEANFASGEETHADFHRAAMDDPVLRAAAEERVRRFETHESDSLRTVEFHRQALQRAGFAEAAEVWRHREDAVLLAVR